MISRPSLVSQLHGIHGYVREAGECIHQAKTEYGVDLWECDGIIASVGDGGSTITLKGPGFKGSSVYGRDVDFEYGEAKDLTKLYDELFGEW